MILLGLILIFSALVTGIMVRYAAHAAVLDVPNDRSLHTVPTPRGGGLAIVLAFFLGAVIVMRARQSIPDLLVFLGGAALIAVIGWLDDKYSLSAKMRLLVHLLASGLFVGILVSHLSPQADLLRLSLGLPAVALVLGLLMMTWAINFYNFMDGSDGIAASEAITTGLVWGLIALSQGSQDLAFVAFVLVSACTGFLLFNWSPARIFMGDIASGFLGFCFMGLFLLGDAQGKVALPIGLILLGSFVVDSSYTLFKRLLSGKNVAMAHRDHAYQHACRMGYTHRQVASAVIAINLLWLTPLALACLKFPGLGWLWVAVAYFPLLWIERRFKAGVQIP